MVGRPVETRSNEDGSKTIVGYAAVFNDFSHTFYDSWVERIMPGAFDDALKKSDVRALFNHDPNIVLGRSSAGTLRLTVDDVGLRYEIEPPETQTAQDLTVSIDRRDIDGSSFSFVAAETQWEELEIDGRTLSVRNIVKFDQVFDVGPVTFPAYPTTEADLRSMEDVLAEKTPADKPEDRSYEAAANALALKINILEKGV